MSPIYDGHSGIDFAYETGRPILAAASGILEVPLSDNINMPSGSETPQQKYNSLKVIHNNGLETWYLHAVPGSECIAFGTCPNRPTPGQQIAVSTGDQIVDPFVCVPAVKAIDPSACIGNLWR